MTTNYDALFKAMRVALEQVQELDKAVKQHDERKVMTDLSKIDFTQLKLEPIGNRQLSVVFSAQDNGCTIQATYPVAESMAFATIGGPWVLLSGVIGIDRERADELWKRTEQVDEFIKQQSRRRITVLELAKELIETGAEIRIEQTNGIPYRYRFNRAEGRFEFFENIWHRSTGLGDSNTVVTIID